MHRLLSLSAALALLAGAAQAQTVIPGDQFMTQWDLDGNGQVTLAEAREQRGNIFDMFDADGNGRYSEDEIKGIDEHKLAQIEAGMGPGHQMPAGMTPPAGRGPGKGPGNGQGMGPGLTRPAEDGLRMFDANQDGTLTRDEFVAGTDGWFAMRDRNRDGVLTTADFGRGN
ncbi:hypothetical protein EOW65_14440 [Sinirhodobacter ferrireducens]|uniref:EF-hand domain-containing protein n=1 Tax=Paenirhodobacter ferrireducens TaxID=1215032 RepID=A0A443LAV0_9RHOB|nr:hypothetical protein [Sinirhodobacter ferrireducens]RWR46309.1 hypothetical protein EOW65_14440 [Sinirhodobacter ferrireducens]